jgi:hypothetical protein
LLLTCNNSNDQVTCISYFQWWAAEN